MARIRLSQCISTWSPTLQRRKMRIENADHVTRLSENFDMIIEGRLAFLKTKTDRLIIFMQMTRRAKQSPIKSDHALQTFCFQKIRKGRWPILSNKKLVNIKKSYKIVFAPVILQKMIVRRHLKWELIPRNYFDTILVVVLLLKLVRSIVINDDMIDMLQVVVDPFFNLRLFILCNGTKADGHLLKIFMSRKKSKHV